MKGRCLIGGRWDALSAKDGGVGGHEKRFWLTFRDCSTSA